MPYRLSASLRAHSSDVKAVASPTTDLVISASRDQTAIVWSRTGPSTFNQLSTCRSDGGYIYAVAVIPGSSNGQDGRIVTGHHDTLIRVWSLDPTLTEPLHILHGHSHVVSALAAEPDGTIISGSWDSSAKVWRNYEPVFTLAGHSQSVLAVHALGSDEFLTGSGDRTIKLWKGKQCIRTYTGHKDAVRGLTILTDIGFASCSNDGDILWWTHDGDIISKFSGHGSYVYSLAALPSGDLVSAGEDRTVRLWRDGELTQVITHPAISVWSISVMPNGDIVSGASDGVVRIFTESEDRVASAEDLKAFDDQVAAQTVPAQTLERLNVSEEESLSVPGTKAGELKFIKKGSAVEVYEWDNVNFKWQKTGHVTDQAAESGGKKRFQGKDYDYVFDVDIKEGAPPLKLPYNVGENPYTAAQRFLDGHQLPMSYLDQVADFIKQNAATPTIGGGGEEYQDPFTGATRYRAAPSSSAAGAAYQDPFTGASRYQPSARSTPLASPPASYGDPFTGGARYTPSSASPAPPTQINSVLPMLEPQLYKLIQNPQGLHKLLTDNNTNFRLAMTQTELSHVENILAQDNTPVPSVTASHIRTVVHLLDTWPSDAILPVVDLARITAGRYPELIQSTGQASAFFDALVKAVGLPQLQERPRDIWITLALRALANLAPVAEGEWVSMLLTLLLDIPYASLSGPQRIVFATILSNFSIAVQTRAISSEPCVTYVGVLENVLSNEEDDLEALYRALVSLGNTLHAVNARLVTLDAAQRKTLRDAANTAVSRLPAVRPERKAVGQAVLALLN